MPIKYRIDRERRLVLAKGHGVLTLKDILGYQEDVWSHPELSGYNELVDMSGVEHIASPSIEGVRGLAKLSAGMDTDLLASRFAIVAPTDLAFGLGCMYEAYRSINKRSTKQVGVFRSLAEALAFLGVSGQLDE